MKRVRHRHRQVDTVYVRPTECSFLHVLGELIDIFLDTNTKQEQLEQEFLLFISNRERDLLSSSSLPSHALHKAEVISNRKRDLLSSFSSLPFRSLHKAKVFNLDCNQQLAFENRL